MNEHPVYTQRQTASLTPTKPASLPSHPHKKNTTSNKSNNFIPSQMQRFEVDMRYAGTYRETDTGLKHDNSSLSIKDHLHSPAI